jgi:hypothetical protein
MKCVEYRTCSYLTRERLVKMTLEGAQAKVIGDGKISAPFTIDKGVRHGDGSSETLFYLTLHKALKEPEKIQYDSEQINTNLWICR